MIKDMRAYLREQQRIRRAKLMDQLCNVGYWISVIACWTILGVAIVHDQVIRG